MVRQKEDSPPPSPRGRGKKREKSRLWVSKTPGKKKRKEVFAFTNIRKRKGGKKLGIGALPNAEGKKTSHAALVRLEGEKKKNLTQQKKKKKKKEPPWLTCKRERKRGKDGFV